MTYQVSVFRSADNQLIDQLTSENKILNFEPQVFCPDYVAKIRSGLSITVLEKKTENLGSRKKKKSPKAALDFFFLRKFSRVPVRA